MPNGKHHRVLIVGGGTAGITVAAILRRRARSLDIAIIEPEQEHYYQPALTLVGAGVYPLAKTHRPEASVMPPGVQWIRGAAKTFEPERNTVRLQDGDAYIYDYLANDDFLRDHPDIVRRFLKTTQRAARYLHDHVDEAIAFNEKLFDLPHDLAVKSVMRERPTLHFDGQLDHAGLRQAIELQSRLGAIDGIKPLAAFVADGFQPQPRSAIPGVGRGTQAR